MKSNQCIKRICPICKSEYQEHPAISRLDNQTEICPDCGTRQALEMMNVPEDQIDHIISTIHQSSACEN